MPAHRKLTHELSFWGLTGILGVLAIQKLLQWIWVDPFIQTFLPIGVGLPIFLGVVTHLSMDTVQTYVREYDPDPLKQRAAQLAPWVPKYKPIFVDIPQLARIALDRTAPRSIRLFVLVTALYGVIPLDLIPDTIIGIGWTEDLAIYLGLRRTVYSGYQHGEGVTGSLKRQLTTVLKIYVPVLILSLFAIFAYFEFMS
jgi:uncharacterized membrane protein YkvA (DUF1232 family)